MEGFCKRYMTYKTVAPEFNGLFRLYRERTKDYGCRMSYLKLGAADIMSNIPFGYNILQMMKDAKTIIIG